LFVPYFGLSSYNCGYIDMESSQKNRDRIKNFDSEETEFLYECVAARIQIIENKKTDGKSMHSKNAAWADIEKEFLANPNVNNRTKTQISERWKNMKSVRLYTSIYFICFNTDCFIQTEHFYGTNTIHLHLIYFT
jgi:hypothetical protein